MTKHIVTYYDDDGNVIATDIVNDREAALLQQLIAPWERGIAITPHTSKNGLTLQLLEHARAERRAYTVMIPFSDDAPDWVGKVPSAKWTTIADAEDGRPSISLRHRNIHIIVWAETAPGAIARAKEGARAYFSRVAEDNRVMLDVTLDWQFRLERNLDPSTIRRKILAAIDLDSLDLGDSKGTWVG